MKRKKYITTGAFIGILLLVGGAFYYFYPNAIKNILASVGETNDATEVDTVQYDTSSSTDVLALNTISSSSQSSFSDTTDAGNGQRGGNDTSDVDKASASQSDAFSSGDSVTSVVASGDNADDIPITETTTAAGSSSSTISLSSCSFPISAPSTTREVALNEIAWMGSASSSDAEWMELKNISTNDIDLSGWELLNASGKIKILFSESDAIPGHGFFLLSRGSATAGTDSAASASDQKIYSGGLVNAGDILALIDPQCMTSDYLDASQGWPGGNNTTKQTLERDVSGEGWHTSALPGGTPNAENSAGPPLAQYKLTIAFQGVGPDSIVSDPANLICGASCTGSYASGTKITLTPKSGENTTFSGWSGPCYGEIVCSLTITANTSLTASFRSTLAPPPGSTTISSSVPPDTQPTPTTTTPITPTSTDGTDVPTSSNPAFSANVLISAVQIASASSSANDFVTLYNPTGSAVDMSGWKLHKKSQTGTDYSIKAFPVGSVISAGQSFTWANSGGGFSEAIGANVSSTETLSADNSVALIDANGDVIDGVAWGTGTGQYGEGLPYPTDPVVGQVLVRQSMSGVMMNTGSNANDFALQ
jgi:hypothetical protein